MASKLRAAREAQKAFWEAELGRRIEFLNGKGFDDGRVARDTEVKRIKAKIRETAFRLSTIAAYEKKLEDMARLREEKKAAPPKVKGKKAAEAVVEAPKAKKKEKKKEAQADAPKKEPKKKAEKAEKAEAAPAAAPSQSEA
ncbi:MAG TPA: hypothetical protein PLA18_11370 [Deltaproteobacteria bacterium]|jgi:outer membrane biosynthesis protein TonB|nr:hypothetical protein [Deltaproteobacteria bacterium]